MKEFLLSFLEGASVRTAEPLRFNRAIILPLANGTHI
jgi:hypothetical protein